MSRAVFLDRDGTLIEDVDYLSRVEQIVLFPWTADALRLLNRAGFLTVVVTNQSGVARGLFPTSRVDEVHAALDQRLEAGRARIDRYYYCPHLADAPVAEYRRDCDCRKPRPGLIRQACADLEIDLSQSWMVGDRWRDLEAGAAAGVRSLLLDGAALRSQGPPADARPDAILNNLMEAVGWILRSRTSI
jgi:D-glycero-D-manno-heptose 1,7-bisphosphate phosphatase